MSATPVVYDLQAPQERNRLTIFFRLILAIPHFVVITVLGIGAFFVVFAAWFVLLITGRWPEGMYNFVAGVNRYYNRVQTYIYLGVDAYPPFDLDEHPEYPVRLHIGPPKPAYSRLKVLFRIILYIPIYIYTYALTLVLMYLFSPIVWVVSVIAGRTPEGLMGVLRFCLSYLARAQVYVSLLSEEWPAINQDGATIAAARNGAGEMHGFATPSATLPPPPPPPPPGAFGR